MQGFAASSDVFEPLRKLAETAARDVYKPLKYTQTPLHTAREAGKALLESAQLCGAELTHALLGDMPDTQALEAAAQSLKQQMEDCPVDGRLPCSEACHQIVHRYALWPQSTWACSNAGVGYTLAGPCSE